MSTRQIVAAVLAAVALIVLLLCLTCTFVNLDAKQIMVIQSPVSGTLTWYTTPGVKWLGFGHATKYDKRSQFWFSNKPDQGKTADESIKIRFNDGGHANISGGVSWELPLDDEHLNMVQSKFGSQQALEQQLVRTMVEKSVYMTGPIMSSKESYAERRNDLLHLIEDQIQNGVYLTKTTSEKTADPITGAEKTIAKVDLVLEKDKGLPARAEESPLKEFGIKVFNLSINEIKYDDQVEEQIKQQQQLTMQVQTAIATAKQAEQEALTSKQQGQASAAKAEWEQKTISAKEVAKAEQDKKVAQTLAEQKVAVSKLDMEAAENFKKAETSRGEGEAARRKAVMAADGALEKKLQAYITVNENYAKAIQSHVGPLVPAVVMGGGDSRNGPPNSVNQLVDMFSVKAAKELALDMHNFQFDRTQGLPAPTGKPEIEHKIITVPPEDK